MKLLLQLVVSVVLKVHAVPVAELSDGSIYAAVGIDAADASKFGTLEHLSKRKSDSSLVVPTSVWAASFVIEEATSAIALSDQNPATRSVVSQGTGYLELLWANVAVGDSGAVNVSLKMSLVKGAIEHKLSFATVSDGIGLWDWTLHPAGGVVLSSASSIFENAGFGVVHTSPSSFSGVYPQHTLQFMASFGGSAGVYVAAHDAYGASKKFWCTVGHDSKDATFGIGATPPDAGMPFNGRTYEVEYPVVVSVFDGDWWDASQIYRSWVLNNAIWTKQGPMAHREGVPSWLFNLTTWVNSHWQQNDIFNVSGGDPKVVFNQVAAIAKRFNLASDALALHWYEWDTLGYEPGSNYSKCATEVTCGFDTHYPEYFPVRDGFADSLKEMQKLGVRVAPYINGRIFDKATKSWTNDRAELSAAKSAVPTLGVSSLSTYEEQYGSKAKFAVMCPHTDYWQDTIAGVVAELTGKYGTDGVYIDQIAAAGPRQCWDPSHNHSVGGGDHWVSGYRTMLDKTRAAKGSNTVLLTESNSEPFIGGIDLFLTLVGFSSGNLPSTPSPGGKVLTPAFQSVYGGYVLPVGAEYFQKDFIPDPNVFAAKIASNYIFGAQMGWFSLGGRSNQHPSMGVFDELMDPKYDSEIFYLQALSKAKQTGKDWFNHGRAMRSLDLLLNGTRAELAQGESFGAVMSSTWLSADEQSLLVTITTFKRYTPAMVSATLDLSNFGFAGSSTRKYDVWMVPYDGSGKDEHLGTYGGGDVKINMALGVHAVVLARIQEASEQWV